MMTIFEAIKQGNIAEVKKLLVSGIDVNVQEEDELSPIHLAADVGSVEIVTLLIEHGADPASFTLMGRNTAMHSAAIGGRIEVIQFLITIDANLLHQRSDDEFGYLPIHVAAQYDQVKVIKFLLEQNIDINVKTTNGKNILYVAAEEGSLELLKFIDKNTNITQKRSAINKKYPIHAAAENGHLDAVKFLEKKHTNIYNLKTKNGETILDLAAKEGHLDVVEYLVNERQMKVDGYVIQNAAKNGHLDVTRFLMTVYKRDHTDMNLINNYILKEASSVGLTDVVKFIIEEENAEVNIVPEALHNAAKLGNPEMAEILLNNGAKINTLSTDTKQTAMDYAVLRITNDALESDNKRKLLTLLIENNGYITTTATLNLFHDFRKKPEFIASFKESFNKIETKYIETLQAIFGLVGDSTSAKIAWPKVTKVEHVIEKAVSFYSRGKSLKNDHVGIKYFASKVFENKDIVHHILKYVSKPELVNLEIKFNFIKPISLGENFPKIIDIARAIRGMGLVIEDASKKSDLYSSFFYALSLTTNSGAFACRKSIETYMQNNMNDYKDYFSFDSLKSLRLKTLFRATANYFKRTLKGFEIKSCEIVAEPFKVKNTENKVIQFLLDGDRLFAVVPKKFIARDDTLKIKNNQGSSSSSSSADLKRTAQVAQIDSQEPLPKKITTQVNIESAFTANFIGTEIFYAHISPLHKLVNIFLPIKFNVESYTHDDQASSSFAKGSKTDPILKLLPEEASSGFTPKAIAPVASTSIMALDLLESLPVIEHVSNEILHLNITFPEVSPLALASVHFSLCVTASLLLPIDGYTAGDKILQSISKSSAYGSTLMMYDNIETIGVLPIAAFTFVDKLIHGASLPNLAMAASIVALKSYQYYSPKDVSEKSNFEIITPYIFDAITYTLLICNLPQSGSYVIEFHNMLNVAGALTTVDSVSKGVLDIVCENVDCDFSYLRISGHASDWSE